MTSDPHPVGVQVSLHHPHHRSEGALSLQDEEGVEFHKPTASL